MRGEAELSPRGLADINDQTLTRRSMGHHSHFAPRRERKGFHPLRFFEKKTAWADGRAP